MITQLRFRNTYDIGEVRNEMAHAVTTFDRDTQHVTYVFRVLHLAEGRLQCIQRRSDTGCRIVYFMGDHTDHLLVGFLLRLENFLCQYLHQIERMMESPVHKR